MRLQCVEIDVEVKDDAPCRTDQHRLSVRRKYGCRGVICSQPGNAFMRARSQVDLIQLCSIGEIDEPRQSVMMANQCYRFIWSNGNEHGADRIITHPQLLCRRYLNTPDSTNKPPEDNALAIRSDEEGGHAADLVLPITSSGVPENSMLERILCIELPDLYFSIKPNDHSLSIRQKLRCLDIRVSSHWPLPASRSSLKIHQCSLPTIFV